MSANAGIDSLTAAELSQAAYPGYSPPAGWSALLQYSFSAGSGAGINSFTTFLNTSATEKQIVIAFQGTDFGNAVFGGLQFQADLADQGWRAWNSLSSAFQQILAKIRSNPAYAGYQIMTDGHSLGGGLAQTAALEYGLSGYGQNSLPVSKTAITTDPLIVNKGGFQNALAAWKAAGNTFSEVNTAGDPATAFFAGQSYISTSTSTPPLANPYTDLEAFGAAIAGVSPNSAYVPGPLVAVGEGIAAYGEFKAHSIGTIINLLQNGATQTVAQSLQAGAIQSEGIDFTSPETTEPPLTSAAASFALAAFIDSTTTLNPDGSVDVTESNGLAVTLSGSGTIIPSTLQEGQDFIFSPDSSDNFLLSGSDLSQYQGTDEAVFAFDPITDNVLAFEQSSSSSLDSINLSTQSNSGLILDDSANDSINIRVGGQGSTTMQSLTDFSNYGASGDAISLTYGANGGIDLGFDLASSSTTEITADDSFSNVIQDFTFTGPNETLEIAGLASFVGTISNFQPGDTIDLAGISATSAVISGSNILSVIESSGTTLNLNLAPSSSNESFSTVSDGNGGTDIVDGTIYGDYAYSDITIPSDLVGIGFSGAAVPTGINDSGDIVGYYDGGVQPGQNLESALLYNGFADFDGNVTEINDPVPGADRTNPVGINNDGTIIGNIDADPGGYIESYSFLYAAGSFVVNHYFDQEILGFLSPYGEIFAINDNGDSVGEYNDNETGSKYFFQKDGTYTSLPSYFVPTGINDSDEIVGYAYINKYGAIYQNGTLSLITVLNPPATEEYTSIGQLEPTGINNDGIIVGNYTDTSGKTNGFIDVGGVVFTVDRPNAGTLQGTQLFGINDEDDVVGNYVNEVDGKYVTQAFVAAPLGGFPLMLSPTAGTTDELAGAFSGLDLSKTSVQGLTIGGPGTVALTGGASVPNINLSNGGNLTLNLGTLTADLITIDVGGILSGNGTIAGEATNNGAIAADNGLLDLTGDVAGSGLLFIDSGATLLLDGTITATETVVYDGRSGTLFFGATANIMAPIVGFGIGDVIALDGQSVIADIYDSGMGNLTLLGSSGAEYTLGVNGTYLQTDFVITNGYVITKSVCR